MSTEKKTKDVQPAALLNPISNRPILRAYGPKLKITVPHSDAPGAKQSFKDECDINVIMAQYMKTGMIDFVSKNEPRYHDVTGYEYQEAMNIVATAKTMFQELPAETRARFDNDPGFFLDFVHDPDNRAEMHELGLLKPDYQRPLEKLPTASTATPSTGSGAPVGAPGAMAADLSTTTSPNKK